MYVFTYSFTQISFGSLGAIHGFISSHRLLFMIVCHFVLQEFYTSCYLDDQVIYQNRTLFDSAHL